MAEALMNHICGDRFDAQSAGLEPGEINPLAVAVMREEGIDIASNHTKSALDLFAKEHSFDYVIAVCDLNELRRCPTFPGRAERLHWPMPDVATLEGSDEEKIEQAREIRDRIKSKVLAWQEVFCAAPASV